MKKKKRAGDSRLAGQVELARKKASQPKPPSGNIFKAVGQAVRRSQANFKAKSTQRIGDAALRTGKPMSKVITLDLLNTPLRPVRKKVKEHERKTQAYARSKVRHR